MNSPLGNYGLKCIFFQLSDRKKLSPVNWYINNGYDAGHKENPVFVETIHDTAHTSKIVDHQRHRAVFNGITEEDDDKADSAKEELAHNMKEAQTVEEINRLKQIYVDVEPNNCHDTSGYGNQPFVPGSHAK